MVRIRVLVDNSATPGLMEEHGFAAWVELADQTILFDTGQGTAYSPMRCSLEPSPGHVGIELNRAF